MTTNEIEVEQHELLPPHDFRSAMSRLAHSVTVVTSRTAADTACGLTCSAFMSVSAEPPLVAVGVHARSRSLDAIRETGVFCVNVLAPSHESVALVFASGADDRFTSVAWHPSPTTGAPILSQVIIAYFDCELTETVPAGDHVVVFGRVRDVAIVSETPPLIHCQREFGSWSKVDSMMLESKRKDA
jgi:flavin reductase (DIM6/NTAB) family NADH-FMN oxidoreductase RutF